MGIACVLVAERKYDRTTVQLKCKHDSCSRRYKLSSFQKDLEFDILYDGEILHEDKVWTTRPLNGDYRDASDLRVMGVREFIKKNKDAADRNLTSQGNLDTIKSREVAYNLKSEVLSENDLDRDHIQDLSKWREQQLDAVKHHVPGSEVFIQHVASNDFYVHAFSAIQIKILKRLLMSGEAITIHCDATGSIIMAPDGVVKRIYYYVLSVAS